MKTLGAILAGGKASRFGSDKAHALYKGARLIDHVGNALSAQCDAVILCGREEAGYSCITDMPEAGLGPLGGLNAALHHAKTHDFSHVLSAGVDIPDLPKDLLELLSGAGAAIVDSQPVVALWPAQLASELNGFIEEGGRSLYRFADRAKARRISIEPPLMNINRPTDLLG